MRYNKDTCLKIPLTKQELESAPSLVDKVFLSYFLKTGMCKIKKLFFSTTCTYSKQKKKKKKNSHIVYNNYSMYFK